MTPTPDGTAAQIVETTDEAAKEVQRDGEADETMLGHPCETLLISETNTVPMIAILIVIMEDGFLEMDAQGLCRQKKIGVNVNFQKVSLIRTLY